MMDPEAQAEIKFLREKLLDLARLVEELLVVVSSDDFRAGRQSESDSLCIVIRSFIRNLRGPR